MSRDAHIEALWGVPGLYRCPVDSRAWDVHVATTSASVPWVTLRTFLPEGFPMDAPRLHVLERGVVHPLLNEDQWVVGSAALRAWNCAHSNLGAVGGRCLRADAV